MANLKKKKGIAEPSWTAIRSLLDDDSEGVRGGLIKLLQDFPDEGREFLIKLCQGEDSYLAKHAQNIIQKLGWIDGAGDFLRFIRSLRYELETGWFLLGFCNNLSLFK